MVTDSRNGGQNDSIRVSMKTSKLKWIPEQIYITLKHSDASKIRNQQPQVASEERTVLDIKKFGNISSERALQEEISTFQSSEKTSIQTMKLNIRTNESESTRLKKLRKAGQQLFLIVLSFLICWCPSQIFLLASSKGVFTNGDNERIFIFLLLVFFLHSLIDRSRLYQVTLEVNLQFRTSGHLI